MKSMITISALCFLVQLTFAQTKFGIRLSYGICNAKSEQQFFVTPENKIEYKFSFMAHRSTKAVGLFLQKKVGFLYLQPELLYRTTELEFKMVDYFSKKYSPHKMNEKYHYFHFPFTAGIYKNNFRLGAGPVFNYLIGSETKMDHMNQISEKDIKLQYGFQMGFGFDYRMFFFDIKYELSFSKIGEHVYYTEERQNFNSKPNLLNFSLGIAF